MADESILTPGYLETKDPSTDNLNNLNYLEKDNYLSEFESEGEKAVVRNNLNVPSRDEVYDKDYVDSKVAELIKNALEAYLNMEDPHGILPQVESMIVDMAKTDGSTPFTAPLTGVDPLSDNHLTTKKFVSRLLKDHINEDDPHKILPEVEALLEQYVKLSNVYTKSQVYTKTEVDQKTNQFIKKDGTTPFTKPQVGADPTIDSHLATKRYADKILRNHLIDVDPHGFLSILNNRLASYSKKKDIYDKTQTYSRTQIDSIITSLVNQAIGVSIKEYIDSINDKFEDIRKLKYTKLDGSVPFRNPQAGVDAVSDTDLVTLRLLKEAIDETQTGFNLKIDSKECEWKTSGPVLTNVGMVEKGNEFASAITLQEVMDAIFYGKGISVTASELVKVGDTATIEVCVQGSLASLEYGELYQNGQLIHSFTRGEFEESNCITVSSLPIEEDTEFVFKAFYINGSVHEVSTFTKLAMPIFVGIIPKWKFGNTITYDYLMQLYFEDGVNNKFYDNSNKLARIDHKFEFSGKDLKQILLALPADYPDLYQMVIPSQLFGIEAFDVIDMIPFLIPGTDKDIVYKLYIYKQAIVQLNNPTTFNFVTDHE